MMSILRNPVDRLMSHLNWTDRFNNGFDPEGLKALNEDRRAVVQQLKNTDPDSRRDLEALFLLDQPCKATWFFNRQVASLFVHQPNNLFEYLDLERISDADLERRVSELEVCTTLSKFLRGLSDRGINSIEERKVNGAQTQRFTRTTLMEDVCARYVAVDERLLRLCEDQTPDLDRIAALFLKRTYM